MAIPLLEAIEIEGKEVSVDALLTQRKLADYRVTERRARYHFTVKRKPAGAAWLQTVAVITKKEHVQSIPILLTVPLLHAPLNR